MCFYLKLVLGFIFFLVLKNDCLKVIPERCAITYLNESYIINASLTVRRANRGGPYVANGEWVSLKVLGNNVSLDWFIYEYLHNEYRRSFVELHIKMCDLIIKDAYIGQIIRNGGLTTCPIPLGKTSMKNINLNVDIPSVFPFEKGKIELIATDNTNGVMIAKGEIVATFKQK